MSLPKVHADKGHVPGRLTLYHSNKLRALHIDTKFPTYSRPCLSQRQPLLTSRSTVTVPLLNGDIIQSSTRVFLCNRIFKGVHASYPNLRVCSPFGSFVMAHDLDLQEPDRWLDTLVAHTWNIALHQRELVEIKLSGWTHGLAWRALTNGVVAVVTYGEDARQHLHEVRPGANDRVDVH